MVCGQVSMRMGESEKAQLIGVFDSLCNTLLPDPCVAAQTLQKTEARLAAGDQVRGRF